MLIIDRFEGEWAVVESGGTTFNLPRYLLPQGAREGDVIRISVAIDRKATRSREETVRGLAEGLFED